MSSNDIAVSVRGLSKSYTIAHNAVKATSLGEALAGRIKKPVQRAETETFWALKDVDFDIQKGDVVGIIGRNGAGKSTLLKILSQITEPTTGEIKIYGRVGSLLEVGTGFHPELTGRENIFLNGAILGMRKSEIERQFDAIVDFAEVEQFLDTPVKRYSSGMYVRLAFAVAAHLSPEVLIIDEVLAVGDINFQKKCMGKMQDVAAGGRTVLFVSHNSAAISSLCKNVLYLEHGRVKEFGAVEPVILNYLSEFLNKKDLTLDEMRVPTMGEELRFCDISLMSEDPTGLPFGEPLRYELVVESRKDQEGLSIGSSVFDDTGACVGTLFTNQLFSLKAHERCKLHLTVPNFNLAPGVYHSGFSVGRGGGESGLIRHDLDIVIGKPKFQIQPVSEGNTPLMNWNSGWGHVVLNSVLSVEHF